MATWAQISGTPRSVLSIQSTTDTPPTTSDTDGLNLDEVAGFVLHVMADSGQTINAAGGVLQGYRYNSVAGVWVRASELDVTITADDIGGRGFSTAFQVASPRGRVAHIANGVGVSGGGLTLYYLTSYLSGKNG